jgi:aconitate decarboxylase
MHVLDYEPMWNPANHSLSTTLPALLAVAEMAARGDAATGASPIRGEDILRALNLGVEAQERLRLASSQFEPGQLGFHPPGAVGALGSAFACGLLLGLDNDALVHALGIAASRACGIQGNVGSMTKALHCGQAALSGLEAALLAARGFTADADALAGPRGYGHVFYGTAFEPDKLTERRAALFVIDPGPAFKFYPSQFGTHFVITAALDAQRQIAARATASAIRHVRITAPPMPYVDRPAPPNGLAGKFSFQYTAAAALLDGDVSVKSFADARRHAPDMEAMLPRIAIHADPVRQGRFDRMKVDLEVELDDGSVVHASCDGPPGVWGRPAERSRVEHKARACLEAAGHGGDVDAILAAARELRAATGPDLVRLLDRLA